ncbi:hypothetical protein FRC10_004140 [Ceratobasidium sp. 414]|nr:hypothetical protein FRC10_004140 [Ceratobasidium sp. 414]
MLESDILAVPGDHEEKVALLLGLASVFSERFDRFGSKLEDLEGMIRYQSEAAQLTPDSDPDKPETLDDLGNSYQHRFELLQEPEDIKKAIEYHARAVFLTPDDHPDKPGRLDHLGLSYQAQFGRDGQNININRALECLGQAVVLTPENHPSLAGRLNNLGLSYRYRFEHLGALEDIQQSIKCQERAVLLTPTDHSDRFRRLSNLGSSYQRQFEHVGEVIDLDHAIERHNQAVSLAPNDHINRPRCLHNLGNSYQRRFELLGELVDIDKAVECKEMALNLTPVGRPDRPAQLSSLASSYQVRFGRLGELKDIDMAVDYNTQALNLTPDQHPDAPGRLNNLGISFQRRFNSRGDIVDINVAIEYKERAVRLVPNGHPNKPAHLNNLGNSYQRRFEQLGELVDIDKAIECKAQAVLLTPEGHPDRPGRLNSLGSSYDHRFTFSGTPSNIDSAISSFKEAALSASGPPSIRLSASRNWARLSFQHGHTPLDAYKHAMALIPQGLAIEAAAIAISLQQYRLAVEWLEEGRSILRTPFDELSEIDPSLARQLKQVARNLEQAGYSRSDEIGPSLGLPSLEQVAQQRRRLAVQWSELLEKVRRLTGFHDFLQPKPFAELVSGVQFSTVVLLNVHKSRCDAIALKPGSDSPAHIPLTSFSHQKATLIRAQLLGTLQGSHVRSRGDRRPVFLPDTSEDHYQRVLATLWEDVTHPILDDLGYLQTRSPVLPRITWCTTGALAFLPIHAAGCYEEPQSKIFNYVISSYTPTLQALIKPAKSQPSFRGILAVGQAAGAGSTPLPGTITEIDTLQKLASHIPFTRLEGNYATTDAVLSAMEDRSWVHLACHASQNISDPTSSAFQLHGGSLNLATITRRSLQYAELAFLSACETATGDESLPDEALHLAAGMSMVGYSAVIATMWSIKDEDAPLVADRIYAQLLEGGIPDSRKSAQALHGAVKLLREKVGEKAFTRWVPYIHIGC